jgi:ribosomal protein S19
VKSEIMLSKLKGNQVGKDRILNCGGRVILVEDVGRKYILRNGREFFSLLVEEQMVGYYFRDFRFTKATGTGIHIKRGKKKKKK